MITDSQPPIDEGNNFNQQMNGFYGEFGTGTNAQIFYLQSGIKPSELHRLTLISDIPKSECWSVRNLFQREVDSVRVENNILPYFQDPRKVKFFNPLTLTMMPVDSQQYDILETLPIIETEEVDEQNRTWIQREQKGFFKFKYIKGAPQYGTVEWNDATVKIVAIDGQHRLSALKRFYKDTNHDQHSEFLNWTVPVVVFGLTGLTKSKKLPSILDVVRNIFVYINSAAQPPNEVQQILLSDESINAIATQELVEYAHENDVLAAHARDDSKIPLLFFDWRGAESGGVRIPAPGYIKSIEEIRNWFNYYLLGDDLSTDQKLALNIVPTQKNLQKAYTGRTGLDAVSAHDLRKLLQTDFIPGIIYFLEKFDPYAKYINFLREMEERYNDKSDSARHAFHKLRFNVDKADEGQRAQVDEVYKEIVEEIIDAKQDFLSDLIEKDIGLRGVMYAYGAFKEHFETEAGKYVEWIVYSKEFTSLINEIYTDKWLLGDHKLYKHLTYDHNSTTINYRFDNASSGLGCILLLLVTVYAYKNKKISDGVYDGTKEECLESLVATLLRGYRKEIRTQLRDEITDRIELKKEVDKQARAETNKHIKRIETAIGKILGE